MISTEWLETWSPVDVIGTTGGKPFTRPGLDEKPAPLFEFYWFILDSILGGVASFS